MRVRASVQDDPGMGAARRMNGIQQHTFVIGLQADSLKALRSGMGNAGCFGLFQSFPSVDFRLARPQKIKIRTILRVKKENGFC